MNLERNNILMRKANILCGLAVLGGMSYFAVRHYMYVLDSYLYSIEFQLMFFRNNIADANVPLMAEYFYTLGPVTGFPSLMFAGFINHYLLLFSAPSLASSLTVAFGNGTAFFLYFTSSSIIGFMSYGLGYFFLGDILPLLNVHTRRDWKICTVLGVLFAVPYLTVLAPALLSSLVRIRISVFLAVMVPSLIIRSIWPIVIS